eukprot:CAMPEP_0114667830 /NCGR_PEP_ID=MMETSP0191-20121206/35275_1 /TAXON_ID=126664 /ORGANISM="Sorites sp." /LENGTH=79 /DNA_ID=CAMNT_0001919515 /DNA_START=18 /DNA_END=254 /DNA_ORIENTATION=-
MQLCIRICRLVLNGEIIVEDFDALSVVDVIKEVDEIFKQDYSEHLLSEVLSFILEAKMDEGIGQFIDKWPTKYLEKDSN